MPCVHIDEFAVGETLTLKPTDVWNIPTGPSVALVQTLSCSPDMWEGKVEIPQVKLLGASPPASSQVLLRGPCPTPSPPSQRTSLFCSGARGASPLHPGGEGCIELPRSPTVGRQKPSSCTPLQVVTLRVLLVSSRCSVFPGPGEVGGRNLGWGRVC